MDRQSVPNQHHENDLKISDRRLFNRDGSSRDPARLGQPVVEPAKPSLVTQLEEELKHKDALLLDAKQAYRDKLTEFDRFRSRIERDAKQTAERDLERLLADLLEIVDLVDATVANESSLDRSSLAMIQNQLCRWLQKHDVLAFDPVGKPYDPTTAEALDTVDVPDPAQHGLVAKVYKTGYLLKDRLLRAAVVQVGRSPNTSNTEGA